MKTIGIIGAMEEEIENIKPHIDIISTKNIVGLDFYMGKMGGNNVVLVRSGIGKVNAAVCSQVLIDLYAVDYIINVGVAGAINKELKIGDSVEVEIVPKDFGRIAAQTAKQVIIQKLREAEREIVFNEFNDRKGEIVSKKKKKADHNIVIMDLGKLEGIMPAKEQIPTEKYHVNDKIKGYVLDVEKGAKGVPQVIVSRSHPDFVRKLLEFEIPEIYEGVIEIKSVSRDPGNRSKVAVYSPDPNIDPVGSCVGQKGVRIQNVINELNGEKIDVIEWNEDPSIYIASALLPAEVMAVDIKEKEKTAQVIVPDNQLSLAIGKSGQNARLAARLTDWTIDIKSESQFRKILEESPKEDEDTESEVSVDETENESKENNIENEE